MQAKELERNQDPPSPAQNVRRQKTYFVHRENTRTDRELYDLGRWEDAQDEQCIDLISVNGTQIHDGSDVLAPALKPPRIVNKYVRQKPQSTDDFPDHIFFRKEVCIFLFSKRMISSTLWEKMTTGVDLYLNEREIETISYLAAGYGAKEIARELNLSPRTVEHRIETLKRRLGARNVTHLIAMVLLARVFETLA